MTEQFDSLGATIPQINDHLDTYQDKDSRDAEVARIVQAEQGRDEKDQRAGVLGLAPAEAEAETPDKSPEGVQAARAEQQAEAAEKGFLGDTGETPEGAEPVKPADQSAPEGVSRKREDGVAKVRPLEGQDPFDLATAPATAKQAGKGPRLQGKHYQQGFLGEVSTDKDGNRPDLTLQGVLNQEG